MEEMPQKQPKSFFWDLFRKGSGAVPDEFPWQDVRPAGPDPAPEEVERNFQQLRTRINAHPAFKEQHRVADRWPLTRVAAAAAVIFLVAIGGFWFIKEATAYQSYATGFGEFKEVQLPDGSQVKLHANSILKLGKSWEEGQTREVWLEGQAYFNVTKQTAAGSGTNPIKFIVHASGMEVEVLGTRFDVRNREGERRIVLESGKVKVLLGGVSGKQVLHLLPGDMVALDEKRQVLVSEQVEPTQYLAWTADQIVLTNRTLREVADMIEESFDVKVIIRSEQVANLRLSGSIPTKELDKLLEALRVAAEVTITRNQATVIIDR